MQKIIIALFLFIFSMLKAQNTPLFHGKISSESSQLEGIHVINNSSNEGTITDNRGYFSIKANANDVLRFSAVHLEAKQHIVTIEDLNTEIVVLKMKALLSELEEVTLVKYKNIDAVALGIVPMNQKTYTPAERKLHTASTGFIDPLLNLASGRTAMLKKAVKIEKKEMLQEKTTDYFNLDYFTKTLLIPEEYVNGFLFYIVENERYTKAMNDKNITMAAFILSELATKYLQLKEIK
jgi:hypothetical protein